MSSSDSGTAPPREGTPVTKFLGCWEHLGAGKEPPVASVGILGLPKEQCYGRGARGHRVPLGRDFGGRTSRVASTTKVTLRCDLHQSEAGGGFKNLCPRSWRMSLSVLPIDMPY